jgi:Flp pilus assembly protein TadD
MITRYLWLALWPRPLVLYYGWPLPMSLADVVYQATLIVALLALTIFALRRYPRLGFLGLMFFITLAPTSSILPIATEVGAERRMYLPLMAIVALVVIGYRMFVKDRRWREVGAERRMYLALIPIVILAVAACRQVVASPRLRAAALIVVTVLLGTGTVLRTAEYQSSLRLAETTFERWPTPAAHSMLGTELAAAGRLEQAERHLREAASVHPPARYYLGTVLAARGRSGEAIDNLTQFIASQPPELDQVHLARAQLGTALTREGRLDEAAAQYREMVARRPADSEGLRLLAQTLVRQRRVDEAIPLFRRALEARPHDVPALNGLGLSLASSGRLDEAIAVFRRVLELDPRNIPAQQNLARALSLRGQ